LNIFFYWVGPTHFGQGQTRPKKEKLGPSAAGLDSAHRVGWADVPLKRTKGWLLVTVLS